jgi:hypothetical protein
LRIARMARNTVCGWLSVLYVVPCRYPVLPATVMSCVASTLHSWLARV